MPRKCRLGAQDRSSLFLVILLGRTVITLHTPPTPHAPRASSVQVSSMEGACACAQPMINNAGPASRQIDISLVGIVLFWRSEPGLRFLYSYSSRNISRYPLTSPPEAAVLRRRPPKTLLEYPLKKTSFYMHCRLRKSSKCM